MAFLKTILIILLVYFGLKFLIKLLTPYILRYFSKKMGERFQQAFGDVTFSKEPLKKEGSISIDKVPNSGTKSNSTVGEYVDFEEID